MLFYRTKKSKAEIVSGGLPSKITANTLGQLGNALGIVGPMVSLNTFVNPEEEMATRWLEDFEKQSPGQLDDLKVRLGGTDIVDDMFWKKETEDEPLPWHKQLGGRIGHNKRTTPIGKAFGYVTNPISVLLANITRNSHYSPASDAINLYANEPAILQHELGHALDFNKPKKDGGLNLGSRLSRDLYGLSRAVPGVDLLQEAQANRKSLKVLNEILKDKELSEMLSRRSETLPAGFGSYLGNSIGKFAPPVAPFGSLAGAGAGKIYGLLEAAMERQAQKERERTKESAEMPSTVGGALGGAMFTGGASGLLSLVHNLTRKDKETNPPQNILQNMALAAIPGAALGAGVGTTVDSNLSPATAQAIRKALIGAGIGGGSGALSGLLSHQSTGDKATDDSQLKNTLLRNMLLGGTTGAGISML